VPRNHWHRKENVLQALESVELKLGIQKVGPTIGTVITVEPSQRIGILLLSQTWKSSDFLGKWAKWS